MSETWSLQLHTYVCEPNLLAWYWCTRSIQNQNTTNFYHKKFTKLFPLIQCNLNCKNHWPFLRSTCLKDKYSVKAILFFIRIIFNSNGLYAPTKGLKVKYISSSTIIFLSQRSYIHFKQALLCTGKTTQKSKKTCHGQFCRTLTKGSNSWKWNFS